MVFYVVLPSPIFQLYKAGNELEKVSQKFYCQFLIYPFDLVKYLKFMIEKKKITF